MSVPVDIRISALSLQSLLSIAMKAPDQGNLFDMKLPDLLDQLPSVFFSKISEDILVNIFARLEDDPRHLARLSCVCIRFARVIKNTLWRRQCIRVAPALVSDLVQGSPRLEQSAQPPGGWGALQRLLVCCPGLRHAGVMLECWDFGLDRELGSSEEFRTGKKRRLETDDEVFVGTKATPAKRGTFGVEQDIAEAAAAIAKENASSHKKCAPEATLGARGKGQQSSPEDFPSRNADAAFANYDHPSIGGAAHYTVVRQWGEGKGEGHECDAPASCSPDQLSSGQGEAQRSAFRDTKMDRVKRKKRVDERSEGRMREGPRSSHEHPHLACGKWNLTREQGNKLLASRFRADILYICDWPGCVHPGARRKYKLFRGVFKNFKSSQIWRNLKDLKPRKTGVCCAFCSSPLTWDMVSTFCLRRSHEYHDDGEPVVRAFVCEHGHVAGAWTDRPLYNL